MHRTIMWLVVLMAMAALSLAADRRWQTGTWGDVTTQRKLIDFGPGSSGFGPPGSSPAMRAMADVRRFVIETDDLRLEIEDTVPINRRSIDVTPGTMVTFAVEKKSVYVRDPDGTQHKLRLIKRFDRARAEASAAPSSAAPKPAYSALGGGHVVRAVSEAGRYVTLEDGSRWEIEPGARYESAEWESSANVTVRPSREDPGWEYELINTSTDEGALARLLPRSPSK
jgi:hypothetical protein